MRFWRRNQASRGLATTEYNNLPVATDRLERAVMAMAMHAQQLSDRLERVERSLNVRDVDIDLFERLDEIDLTMATQQDLHEMQIGTARLSNEFARVAAELRGEIAKLHDAMPRGSARRNIHLDRVVTNLDGLSSIDDHILSEAVIARHG